MGDNPKISIIRAFIHNIMIMQPVLILEMRDRYFVTDAGFLSFPIQIFEKKSEKKSVFKQASALVSFTDIGTSKNTDINRSPIST